MDVLGTYRDLLLRPWFYYKLMPRLSRTFVPLVKTARLSFTPWCLPQIWLAEL